MKQHPDLTFACGYTAEAVLMEDGSVALTGEAGKIIIGREDVAFFANFFNSVKNITPVPGSDR